MIKAIDKLRGMFVNLRWLARSGGLAQTVTGIERDLGLMMNRVRHIEHVLERRERVEQSHCQAFGHLMQIDPSDSVIAAHLSQRGCFEPYETRLVQQLIKPGQNVIDVGANIGYYSLQFAKLVGASGRVLAFEPDPDNYRLLCQNVARNGYANVTTIPKAVSSQSGTLRLFRNPHNKGDHRVYAGSEPGREVVEVEAVSLDEYVGQLNLPIDVIKFDIQGAEGSAFLGMQRLLKNNPNIQIITEFWPRGLTLCGHDPREFLEQLVALGFKVQVIDETKEQLEDLSIERVLERYPIEPDTDIFFTNLLCCRRAA